MPDQWTSIPDHLQEFIKKQPIFFVASAPLAGKHVNVSPKGHPSRTFAIMNAKQVAFLDAGGSGTETISHIYENGRVTMMWCSFVKTPRIVRLFCRGRVIERDSPEFRPFVGKMRERGMKIEAPAADLREHLKPADGAKTGPYDLAPQMDDGAGVFASRAIIVLDVYEVQKSCGYGVPLLMMGPGGELSEGLEGSEVDAETLAEEREQKQKEKERSESVYDNLSVRFDEQWDDRTTLLNWNAKMVKLGKLKQYAMDNNTTSVDGLPGVKMVRRNRLHSMELELKAWARRVFLGQTQAVVTGGILGFALAFWILVAALVASHVRENGYDGVSRTMQGVTPPLANIFRGLGGR